MAFTHNDLNVGDRIAVRGISCDCMVIGLLDGHRGIKVQPVELRMQPSWIDVEDVTGRVREYRPSGLLFPSFMEAGAYLASKGYQPHSEGYVREVGSYRYHASLVYQGDTKCVHLSFAVPEFVSRKVA